MPAELAEKIHLALPAYGVDPSPATAALMAHYLDLIIAGQRRVRLVGSTDPDILIHRHLGESLAAGPVEGPLVDLGSGSGFPGLTLALAWPSLKTTLVESQRKKADFLAGAVRELGLQDRITVWHGFVARQPPHGDRAPLAGARTVTVRALERMESVPAWLGRWLDPGTEVIFWAVRERADAWRALYPAWTWHAWQPLPAARERGIIRATWGDVSRETPPAPARVSRET